MNSIQSLAERMAESPDRPARVLDAVTGLRRINDREMADLTGWSRPTIRGKRTGGISISPSDVPLLSVALDLPMSVFTMTVPEALIWIAENRRDWFASSEDGGDGGPGAEVTTLQTPAGVVQWPSTQMLAGAA